MEPAAACRRRRVPMTQSSDRIDPQLAARFALAQTQMHRRALLGGAAGMAGMALGARLARPTRAGAQDAPADAAPPERQTIVFAGDVTVAKVTDFYEQVYERPGAADLFSDPLVRLDKNFQTIPAA